MGQALNIDGVMNLVKKMEIKEEINLLHSITEHLRDRFTLQEDTLYWLSVSKSSLDSIWNNKEDEVYNDLLKR